MRRRGEGRGYERLPRGLMDRRSSAASVQTQAGVVQVAVWVPASMLASLAHNHQADELSAAEPRMRPAGLRPGQPTKGRSRRSSWRAIERRCTASGPSTMRSTRAQA